MLFSVLSIAALLHGANAALNCSDYSFSNTFSNQTAWKTDFKRTSSRGLGEIQASDSGEGTDFIITTSSPGSVTVQSYSWFMPPAQFSWDIQGSDVDGVMSALTVWSGFPGGTPEIDLELQGWSQRRSMVMHPIWATGHGEKPIGLQDAPEGWPSDDGGPTYNYGSGWNPQAYDRYVANNTAFSNAERHTYSLDVRFPGLYPDYQLNWANQWQQDSLTWSIDGAEFVTFTRGENSTQWPDGPHPISVGIWAASEAEYEWMGNYSYDESNQPKITVFNVQAQGCSVNSTEEIEAARDSALSIRMSPIAALSALIAVGFWMLA